MRKYDVAVGQFWQDADPRAGDRTMVVLKVDEQTVRVRYLATGKERTLGRHRFHGRSNGYRLAPES